MRRLKRPDAAARAARRAGLPWCVPDSHERGAQGVPRALDRPPPAAVPGSPPPPGDAPRRSPDGRSPGAVLLGAVDADAVEGIARDSCPQDLLASVEAELRTVAALRGVQPHQHLELEGELLCVL